ncbi:MAG: hypothetical protein WB783_08500 [Arenicellales bacterium]
MILCIVLLLPASLWAADNPPSDESQDSLYQQLFGALSTFGADSPKIEAAIAKNFLAVKEGRMTPEQFYRALAELNTPGHLGPREVLNKVKKDIFDHGGTADQEYFLGRQFAEGGTPVEKKLLTWRRDVWEETVKEVMHEFRGKNVRGSNHFTVFLSKIGSWSTESPNAMRFAGDIDFSFVTGDTELATAMNEEFARLIKEATGLTPEEIDVVGTAHGAATLEVYIGPHGQAFAEDVMKKEKSRLVELDFDNGVVGNKEVPGKTALQRVATEARLAEAPLLDIASNPWPSEPGISLEMIRHLEHDIINKNVYTDIDSFLKGAKYLDRSRVARYGRDVRPPDALQEFAAELIKMKESNTSVDVMAEYVLSHFQGATGKPFPSVTLGPANEHGLAKIQLESREQAIGHFLELCRSKMWENAMHSLDAAVAKQIRAMKGATKESALAVNEEVAKLREMMEVEYRALSDPTAGVKKLPPEFLPRLKQLRSEYHDFIKRWPETGGPKAIATYEFIDEMLKAKQPSSIKLAAGAVLEATKTVNNALDFVDDKLLSEIRGEVDVDLPAYLREEEEMFLARKVREHLNIALKLNFSEAEHASRYQKTMAFLNKDLTGIFTNALTRRIQTVNRMFTEPVQSSRLGRGAMTAMQVFSLADEIPTYIELFYKGTDKGDWGALATEIFRRRIPFGSTVEDYYMGSYYLALWDFCTTLVPPLSMGQVAANIGESVEQWGFKFWYSTELQLFTDSLYANATFRLNEIDRVDGKYVLTRWKLTRLTYKGADIDVDKYIAGKRQQIQEMVAALRVPYSQRRFPVEYEAGDPLTGWTRADDVLHENLKYSDPALVVIDELIKHPAAGEKLRKNYRDFYDTRWAQVKLSFVVQTINQLEKRRAAAKATRTGQIPAMVAELERVTKELAIQKQVEQQIRSEVGSRAWRFISWIRDMIVGKKRSWYAQPAIEPTLEKSAEILIRYLDTYSKILDARNKAEDTFALGAPIDRGLRILTGGYFLSGQPDSDGSAYAQWLALPARARSVVQKELLSIKRKYLPGSGLDLTPGSFDRNTLDLVEFHDVWRELWKHVNSQGIRSQPGFWKVMSIYWTPASTSPLSGSAAAGAAAGAQSGAVGPDPLERHAYHTKQRQDLVATFEAHYKKKARTAESTATGRKQVKDKCTLLNKEAGNANETLTTLNTELDELQRKVTEVQASLSESVQQEKDADKAKGAAETSAQKVIAAKEQMEKAALKICQNTEAHNKAQSSQERDRLLKKIESGLQGAEALSTAADQEHRNTVKNADKLEGLRDSLANLPEGMQKLQDQLGSLETKLAAVEESVTDARSAVTSLTSAPNTESKLRDCDADRPGTSKELNDAEDGVDILQGKMETIRSTMALWNRSVAAGFTDRVDGYAKDARAAADTSEIFLDALQKFLTDAHTCGNLARGSKSVPGPRHASFVIRIEGEGYTPTWAGDSYAITGHQEQIFTIDRKDDSKAVDLKAVKATLEDYRKSLVKDVCSMFDPPAIVEADKAPVVWHAGPRIKVIKGPLFTSSEIDNLRLDTKWTPAQQRGPGLGEIRKAAGCE